MRCTTSFTCIAQCLATYMWRRAGLLTESDYELSKRAGIINPPVSGSGKRYMPCCFLGFSHVMQRLAAPICYDEPLKVDGAVKSDTAAHLYQTEWREQLFKIYQKALSNYVNESYYPYSFKKRAGKSTAKPPIDALNEDLKHFLPSSERLRKSYMYICDLLRAYDSAYLEFRNVIVAVNRISRETSAFVENSQVGELDGLDGAAVQGLDALREKIDYHSDIATARGFNCHIPISVLGTDATRKSVGATFINHFRDYCRKGLAYVSRVPEEVSSEIVFSTVFAIGDVKDPFEHLHFVYPEMDYEAWGFFWRAAHNQVTGELEALQKHADEVYITMHNQDKIAPTLFEDIDSAFREMDTITASFANDYPDDFRPTSIFIRRLIGAVIRTVAGRMIDLGCKEKYQELNNAEAEFAGEPENKKEANK
ncbi:hypothetical protein PAPHI01_0284 [Pancytospora philotis]|nr:hypothetical protein PAPHI01_0284 [Pancytospora philotis]